MKLFSKRKDGGPESTVTGYFLIEIKSLFTIVLLRFDEGSRDAFHSHAFDCISWVLRGTLVEFCLHGLPHVYFPSVTPVSTHRETFHKVHSVKRTWVLSFRGPWAKTWQEFIPGEGFVTLTHGRKALPYENQ